MLSQKVDICMSTCTSSPYNERLLVDVLHVEGDEVLPAAQVKTTLILVHVEDPVIAGVKGQAEWSCCPSVHQIWRGIERQTLP